MTYIVVWTVIDREMVMLSQICIFPIYEGGRGPGVLYRFGIQYQNYATQNFGKNIWEFIVHRQSDTSLTSTNKFFKQQILSNDSQSELYDVTQWIDKDIESWLHPT